MEGPKDYSAFNDTLHGNAPPAKWPTPLQAMWYDAKEDWHNAHEIAQDIPNPEGDWIHAYLHRKEGDVYNARYWYRKANKPFPSLSLEVEQREIVNALLKL
ncbi:hypothetical protein U1E44_09550 [Arenibacter sp. GZD96]|uniref:hypothetical protein n=1 Tax=Aurantibrevibacter litoralis TaxID=3106030 RepID=UPI002AFDCD21|nr:hypothetical protein [Arenibacter sp. GZD-96]MEA1786334.1 hypothetical protein [Arenibacter sp. GZD-96]